MEPTFTPNVAGAVEYLLAVGYLLLFIPFWRYVNGPSAAEVPVIRVDATGWFATPAGLGFHPGHTWARRGDDGLVTVGVDDFAQKLVGPVMGARFPHPGDEVRQGEPAFGLRAEGEAIDVLTPISGRVVETNQALGADPDAVNRDPYGAGWLARIEPSRPHAEFHQLLDGALARKWMEGVSEAVSARMQPELGLLLQDGGTPVNGLARAIDPEHWAEVARGFLRT
jgi:glycine cleavage system H lipoate-binding protein